MKIYMTEDYQTMSRKAANILSAQIILKPNSVLGLATGSTPIGMYKQLVIWYEKGDLDFAQIKTVNLDEYVGLEPTHEQSYRYFMQNNLFDHVNINPANTNVPDGLVADPQAECDWYNQVIRKLGGIDIQVLGMGHNGHIGFNEPCDVFEKGTHVVTQRLRAGNPCGGPVRADHPGQRPVLRLRRRGAPAGHDHGHQVHYDGEEDPDAGQRRG